MLGPGSLPTPMSSRVQSYEQMMGTGRPDLKDIIPPKGEDYAGEVVQSPMEEENEKRELFNMLTKPRVRYDVEVVTKIVIYAGKFCILHTMVKILLTVITGIGWLAVEGNPVFFQVVGLGMAIPATAFLV
jgi:hypothetical protein